MGVEDQVSSFRVIHRLCYPILMTLLDLETFDLILLYDFSIALLYQCS
jgi:hypothetical protein